MHKRFHSEAQIAIAACASALQAGGEIQLMPAGVFRARDGRPRGLDGWQLNEQDAAALLASLALRQDDLVIDYEHQTLAAAKNGQPAPAAGWFSGRDVQWRPGQGLFVTPRWTEAAKAAIAAGEYRYFSPVIRFSPKTGQVLGLEMGAITNNPAIDGMTGLQDVAAAKFLPPLPEQEDGSMKELLKLLGLAPDASEDQAVSALTALQGKATAQDQQIEALKAEVADKDSAIAAAKAETPETAMTALSQMQTELAELKSSLADAEVAGLVDQALEDGKLTPAMKDWAVQLGKSDMAQLKTYLDKAQPIAALKATQTGGRELDPQRSELTETDLAVCSAMGIEPDAYKATLAGA